MKLIILLSFLCSATFARELYPLEFDYTKVKSLYEAPEFAHLQVKSAEETVRGGRIVGGEPARPGQFPHQVMLLVEKSGLSYRCGGSLLYENWILTSASCVHNATKMDVYSILSYNEGYRWKSTASVIFIHQNYAISGTANNMNDIALIKTSSAAKFDTLIDSIALPRHRQNDLFSGEWATIAGFGIYDENGSTYSNEERWVTLLVISNAICANYDRYIQNSQLCTDLTAGKYAYTGDNGSGLFVGDAYNPAGRYLIGIEIGGSRSTPGYYTRVTSYIEWIDKIISS